MVKQLSRAGKSTGRFLALATLTATLAACGGGSGDTVPLEEQDLDGDGEPNGTDPDSDGDGIIDNAVDASGNREDTFIDWDGDGFDDTEFTTVDFEPEETPFTPTPVSAANVCGGEPGSDNNSSTAAWNDNCWVRVDNKAGQGQFAISLYTVGIQRVIYCANGSTAEGETYADFADGKFGNKTEAALLTFQRNAPGNLTADGEVGPSTWAALEAALGTEPQITGLPDANGVSQNAWGVSGGRCEGTPLFYQTVTTNEADQRIAGKWTLARNAPNTTAAQALPFSIDSVDTLD